MISKLQFGLMAGVLALSLGAGMAFAAMSADEAIVARKACMKLGHGGVFGVAVPIFKGDKPFDAAALKAAFENEDKVCADWSKWWGPETKQGSAEQTHALPAIWEDPKSFDAAANAWYAADQALRKTTDLASFKAAFPADGAGCKGCHEKFRAPLQ